MISPFTRVGIPTNLRPGGTFDLLLTKTINNNPAKWPEGQVIFSLYDVPRKVTGIHKVSQYFLRTLLTTKGSDPIRPEKGTQFPQLIALSNVHSDNNNSEFISDITSCVEDASNQCRSLLNVDNINPDEALDRVEIIGIQALEEGWFVTLYLITLAGEGINVAVPSPSLDLLSKNEGTVDIGSSLGIDIVTSIDVPPTITVSSGPTPINIPTTTLYGDGSISASGNVVSGSLSSTIIGTGSVSAGLTAASASTPLLTDFSFIGSSNNLNCGSSAGSNNFLGQSICVTADAAASTQVTVSSYPTINFSTNISVPQPGVTIASYAWDFGDTYNGTTTTSTASSPSFMYKRCGDFTVTLTTTDSNGLTHMSSHIVSISMYYTLDITSLANRSAGFVSIPGFTPESTGTNCIVDTGSGPNIIYTEFYDYISGTSYSTWTCSSTTNLMYNFQFSANNTGLQMTTINELSPPSGYNSSDISLYVDPFLGTMQESGIICISNPPATLGAYNMSLSCGLGLQFSNLVMSFLVTSGSASWSNSNILSHVPL